MNNQKFCVWCICPTPCHPLNFSISSADLGFELWMVMEYHHNGSLLDFLLIHSLTAYQVRLNPHS